MLTVLTRGRNAYHLAICLNAMACVLMPRSETQQSSLSAMSKMRMRIRTPQIAKRACPWPRNMGKVDSKAVYPSFQTSIAATNNKAPEISGDEALPEHCRDFPLATSTSKKRRQYERNKRSGSAPQPTNSCNSPMSRYVMQHNVGQGSTGEVWSAVNAAGEVVAIKTVFRSTEHQSHEVAALLACGNHDSVLPVLEHFVHGSDGNVHIVTELAACDLFEHLQTTGPIPESKVTPVIRTFCQGGCHDSPFPGQGSLQRPPLSTADASSCGLLPP